MLGAHELLSPLVPHQFGFWFLPLALVDGCLLGSVPRAAAQGVGEAGRALMAWLQLCLFAQHRQCPISLGRKQGMSLAHRALCLCPHPWLWCNMGWHQQRVPWFPHLAQISSNNLPTFSSTRDLSLLGTRE